ncbi:MAG: hypothetical protein CSA95_07980 [Bacteroidetes bacterium]|nr:MAG: hypothetical protein CSA95_07980 [Bacteroidota bacterium]PIE88217.1 MAG: hypothetical protein CSA04_03030 [Bacteroidota bacterium]
MIENPANELPEVTLQGLFDKTVLAYKRSEHSTAYLPNNHEASILLKEEIFPLSESAIQEKHWQSALAMQGLWISQTLHPEISDKEWLNLLKYSFISKVMTPATSYLVVENEAQKAMLQKKQQQVLSGNKSLDLGEDTQRMSEPELILLATLAGVILWWRKIRYRPFKRGNLLKRQ